MASNDLENSEIGKIIDIISNLHRRVSENLPKNEKVVGESQNKQPASSRDEQVKSSSQGAAGKKDSISNDQNNINSSSNNQLPEQSIRVDPLDQLDHDLIYMQYALNKLKGFEGTFGKSIQELKDDLEIILASRAYKKSVQEFEIQRDEIRRISQKFLNLKSKIPPVHNNSSEDTDEQQRRRTNQSKDLPNMPDKTRFKEHGFFIEFVKKFQGLDDDQSRNCLLCFAVFPENAVIKKRLLLHWWIGEGFLAGRTENGNMIPAEKVAEKLLHTFEEKGFVLPVDKQHREVANSFRLNPLVRSAVITLAKQENFFDFESDGFPTLNFQECKRTCLVYDHKEGSIPDRLEQLAKEIAAKQIAMEIEAKLAKNGNNILTPRENDLHKELANNNGDLNLTPKEIEQKVEEFRAKIGTLFNVSEEFPEFKYDWFSKMKGIKVLYLGRWQSTIDDIPHIEVESADFLKGLKNMKDLRLLSFQGVSGIRELPKEISYLKRLEILDARACYSLDELPDNIDKLVNLTHLDISECFLLDGIPKKVCKLSKLQVLKGFVITDHTKDDHGWKQQWCSLEDLKKLKQLRKLSININSKEFQAKKLASVLSFENLLELKVSWGGGSSPDKKSTTEGGEAKSTAKKQPEIGVEKSKPISKEVKGDPKTPQTKQGWLNFDKKKQSPFKRTLTILLGKQYTPKEQPNSNLVKLDLQCFPDEDLPGWLIPGNLKNLQSLYIRGGRVNRLDLHINGKREWQSVKVLRLKYLNELKTNWIELRELFPNLEYLEKFKCHKVTLCPCDGTGVWERSELKNQGNLDRAVCIMSSSG